MTYAVVAVLVLAVVVVWAHELRLDRRRRQASKNLTLNKTRPAREQSPGH